MMLKISFVYTLRQLPWLLINCRVFIVLILIRLIMQQQLNSLMKDSEKPNRKYLVDFRKLSISQKTRNDMTNPFRLKEELHKLVPNIVKTNFGRKYVQENLFKMKQKDHHEMVISDELVRNSRQFRLLRQKMQIKQAMFTNQINQLNQSKSKLKQEISQIKSNNYNSKLTLWELKNQILELRNILNEEEDESSKLQKELIETHQEQYQQDQLNFQQEGHMNNEKQAQEQHNSLRIDSRQKQSESDDSQLHFQLLVSAEKSKLNPQSLVKIQKNQQHVE